MKIFYWETKKLFLNRKIQLQYAAVFLFISFLCLGFSWEPALFRIFQETKIFGIQAQEFINGNLFSRLSGIFCLNSLIPIFACVLAASQFAGEEESGVLRTLLASSESRSRIFRAKVTALIVHLIFLILFTFVISYVLGFLFFGRGDLIAGNNYLENILKGLRTIPEKISFARTGLAALLSLLALFPLLSFAIFVCVLTGRSLPSLSITFAVYFGAQALRALPFSIFSRITDKFFVAYMNFWGDVFLEMIPWKDILYMGSFVLAYGISFLALAWGFFLIKNIKS